ncbi:MAG: hypothetical protein AAF541_04815 [Pseudomonadota bacterium]
MTHFLRSIAGILALPTLAACSPPVSMEMEYVDGDQLLPWVGTSEAQLLEAWGKPDLITEQDTHIKVEYFLRSDGVQQAMREANKKDLDSGSQTAGIDDDLLGFLRSAMRETCLAEFVINPKKQVISARAKQFQGGNHCTTAHFQPDQTGAGQTEPGS